MISSRPKYEGWLYLLAFLIALAFRLVQLGAKPLTDSEAELALQAFRLAQGKDVLLSPQPAYILFTSLIFLVTEAANFTARFLPAIVGSTLVFAPIFFREKIKALPALVLAFLISFDPGLVAVSRQANGTMLALTFLLFAWGMWRTQRWIPAGIFAGLALLSGPSIWSGLLTLGLTALILHFIKPKQKADEVEETEIENSKSSTENPKSSIVNRESLIALAVTVLIAGTLFFTSPNGLNAMLASIPAYFQGWAAPSVFTPGRMLLIFTVYEPLGIFLTIFAIVRGIRLKSRKILRYGIWLGVSLLIGIFYRQPPELVWAVIPLLVLASQELARSFEIYPEERLEVGIVAGLVMVMLVYIWFNLSNLGVNPYDQFNSTTVPIFGRMLQLPTGPRYVVLFGASLILIVCLSLVALGWSPRTARLAATWSFTLYFGVYAIAAAWGASGVRLPNAVEMWSREQPPVHAEMLGSSVDEVSLISLGHIFAQPVTILGIESPALEWVLRNHEVNTVDVLDPANAPPLVVTPIMQDLGLPSAYRGQDFTWRQTPQLNNAQVPDWVRWLVYRQLPVEDEMIILWARDDLFPDARENNQQP